MLLGRDLLVFRDGAVIAASKSCEVSAECELVECSSAEGGEFREYAAGRRGWRVTVGFLVSAPERELMRVGDEVLLSLRVRGGAVMLSGWAFCRLCKVTATRGNLATGSFEFEGNGSLESAPV